MFLPLLATALAGTCPERLPAAGFQERVEGLREPVAFADPEAAGRLRALQGMVRDGCVDGLLGYRVLAALFLAEGAYEVLREGGSQAIARERLLDAYAVGSRLAWDDIYGPDVQDLFDEVSARLLGKGVIDLSFVEPPQVAGVDGESASAFGPRYLPEGAHFVQWKDSSGWHGELVALAPNLRVTVGGGAPPLDSGQRQEQQWRRPVEKQRGTAHWDLTAAAGYGAVFATVGHESGGFTGGATFPSASVGAGLEWSALRVRAGGGWDPGLLVDEPPLLTRARLLAGIGGGFDVRLALLAGPCWGLLPAIDGATAKAPGFRAGGAIGAVLQGSMDTWRLHLLARGERLGDAWSTGFEGSIDLADQGLLPELGLDLGWTGRPGIGERWDSYGWILATGGVRWGS